MEKIKLGDVATYINGYAFKPTDWSNDGLEIIRIQNLTGNAYEINKYDGEYDKKYEVNKGDVLISWSASLGIFVWEKETALLNQHIFKVVFDKLNVDKDYFVFQVGRILERAQHEAHGATMRHLTRPVFDALPFIMLDINEQKKIADILSHVQKIINLRQQQITDVDKLIKARFVEMFGDVVADYERWERFNLEEVAEVGSSKRIFEREYASSGIPFYRTKEIVELSQGVSITTELFISQERYNEIKQKYGVPRKGDLLVSAVGTIGKIWIVDGKNEFYFKDGNLIRVVPSAKLDSVYLKYVLEDTISYYKNKMSAGTAYAALTIAGMQKMNIPLPPLDLQNKFAAFVEQADKTKAALTKSLDNAKMLFDSLMQKYFG